MTDEELAALAERVETLGDVPCSVIVDAITTLRARLADAFGIGFDQTTLHIVDGCDRPALIEKEKALGLRA